jgi:hypothetical protein
LISGEIEPSDTSWKGIPLSMRKEFVSLRDDGMKSLRERAIKLGCYYRNIATTIHPPCHNTLRPAPLANPAAAPSARAPFLEKRAFFFLFPFLFCFYFCSFKKRKKEKASPPSSATTGLLGLKGHPSPYDRSPTVVRSMVSPPITKKS